LAIAKTAEILQQTFRDSDIVARLGGDEFVVLAPDLSARGPDGIISRLQENFRSYNEQRNHSYLLALSIGAVHVDPNTDSTIEELIAQADVAMYEHKRSKKRCSEPGEERSYAA
jgi:diguanylate cyclase (GGDEF)-like protein